MNKLTATGTKEISVLVTDARKTLGDISVAFRNLDKNPSRLLFGGAPPEGSEARAQGPAQDRSRGASRALRSGDLEATIVKGRSVASVFVVCANARDKLAHGVIASEAKQSSAEPAANAALDCFVAIGARSDAVLANGYASQ